MSTGINNTLMLSSKSGNFWSCLLISGIFSSKMRDTSSISLILLSNFLLFYWWVVSEEKYFQFLISQWVMVDFSRYFFFIMMLIPLGWIKLLIFFYAIIHGLGIDVNDAVIDYLCVISREMLKNIRSQVDLRSLFLHSIYKKTQIVSYSINIFLSLIKEF